MRMALIADIHGNLDALKAVLEDIEQRDVENIVNLGDVVSGPLSAYETAEILMPLDLPTISGNHERQLLTLSIAAMGESDRIAARKLSDQHRAWLRTFPAVRGIGKDVFLCHGSLENDVDYLLETLDESGCRAATVEEVEARTEGCDARLIACAHSHMPRAVRLGDDRLVINPGSVGLQAYPAKWPHTHVIENGTPHARYAIASRNGSDWDVEFVAVEYDWDNAAAVAEINGRMDWAQSLRTGRVV
ncbi:MAG: metallophosphoesterase family protein [Acidobacteriota bacterium]|nr:metallophosphoesterase family protein [Acidobacteriota bacterium]